MNHLILNSLPHLSHSWPLLLGGAALVPATMPLWYLSKLVIVGLVQKVRQ